MLAIEHELQPPADYITTAGAIGPEHRHFLISWMTMVEFLIGSPAWRVVTIMLFRVPVEITVVIRKALPP